MFLLDVIITQAEIQQKYRIPAFAGMMISLYKLILLAY